MSNPFEQAVRAQVAERTRDMIEHPRHGAKARLDAAIGAEVIIWAQREADRLAEGADGAVLVEALIHNAIQSLVSTLGALGNLDAETLRVTSSWAGSELAEQGARCLASGLLEPRAFIDRKTGAVRRVSTEAGRA
jgi:hypothetical protein